MKVYIFDRVSDVSYKCVFLDTLEMEVLSVDIIKDMLRDPYYETIYASMFLSLRVFTEDTSENLDKLSVIFCLDNILEGRHTWKDFVYDKRNGVICLSNNGLGHIISVSFDTIIIDGQLTLDITHRLSLEYLFKDKENVVHFAYSIGRGGVSIINNIVTLLFDLNTCKIQVQYSGENKFLLEAEKRFSPIISALKPINVAKALLMYNI